MSSDELDQVALEKGGILGEFLRLATTLERFPLLGDWSTKWINNRVILSSLVLIPTTARTYDLRKMGVISQWVELGLTEDQANKLYGLEGIKFKFELVPDVVEILNDFKKTTAYQYHPWTRGCVGWRKRWSIVEDKTLCDMRCLSLAKMVHFLTLTE